MQVAEIIDITEVEGPGIRSAVWFQGCSINCKACCNPDFIPKVGGFELSYDDLAGRFINLTKSDKKIKPQGITILGGEPLDQSEELYLFLEKIKKESDLSIMLFSGYTWLNILKNENKKKVVELCDLVIAGPFIQSLISNKRRWIGSSNQTVHYITDKYKYLENNWEPYYKEVEFHIKDGEIIINGMPIDAGIF